MKVCGRSFIMVGLEVDGKPLLRAYSIASASWEEELQKVEISRTNRIFRIVIMDLEF